MTPLATLRAEAEALSRQLPGLALQSGASEAIHVGSAGRRRTGSGEHFWQYRRYAQTDAADRVDWRRSARGDELFVRETEMESARTFLFWSDPSPGFQWSSSNDQPRKSDRANAILLAVAIKLSKSGERIGSFSTGRRPGIGRTATDRLAEDLFANQPSIPTPQGAAIATIIASDFYDPPDVWEARLHPLAKSCEQGILLQVRDPRGYTCLHYTAFRSNDSMAKILINLAFDRSLADLPKYEKEKRIKAWLDLRTEGDGFTALHFASFRGNLKMIQLFIENGANIQARNNYGINMMHVAA